MLFGRKRPIEITKKVRFYDETVVCPQKSFTFVKEKYIGGNLGESAPPLVENELYSLIYQKLFTLLYWFNL